MSYYPLAIVMGAHFADSNDEPTRMGRGASSAQRGAVHPIDDAALVVAVQHREAWAQSLLWDRFSALVRSVLRRSLGPHDCEDFVQDVFLRCFQGISKLREPSALRCFVIGIAIRVARSELRRRRVRRWMRLTDSGAMPEVEHPVRHAGDAREALVRFYAVLDNLDPEVRLAYVLQRVEGLELEEIAVAMETSLSTVKRRLAKATERLSVLLAKDALLVDYVSSALAKGEGVL